MNQQKLAQSIKDSEAAIKQAQASRSQVIGKLDKMSAVTDPSQMIDIENADLEAVHAHTATMNANIAELIMGLDDVTSSFQGEFTKMKSQSTGEKLIGILFRQKAVAMQQERIRNSSIDDKLTDLINKSDMIGTMLKSQHAVLEEELVEIQENLESTFAEREATVAELEGVRADILAMDPELARLEMELSTATDNVTRTSIESKLAEMNRKHNELVKNEQVLISKSQTLERYAEAGKTWVDSLQNQAATQMVLINKLETDTKQRVVLYDALTKSLKTAQQQDVAHRINEIGVKTDQEAQAAMAGIGAATNARMADMLEAHEDHMVFSRKVLEQKRQADERFLRRFGEIVKKHDASVYQ